VFATGCDPTCLDQYIRKLSRDIERDPLSAISYDTRGNAHFIAGELEAAESDLRRALELSPNALVAGEDLVAVLVERQKATEALTVLEAMPDSYYRRVRLPLVYQALGRTDEATVALQTAIATDSQVAPYEIAQMLAFRGDKKSALDWLERDYDLRLYGISFARMDPLLKSPAGEPRFIALMKKIGPRQQQ
jgi:tetratricopeptide (TPR) repeat protein